MTDGNTKMKASAIFEFGGPDVLQYVDWPIPAPGEGEVLVKNSAVGVGAWDSMWREGAYAYMLPPLPLIPGQISAGRVAAVGPGVSDVKVGDPIHVITLTGGTYADYVVAPRHDTILLPEGIDLVAAACISDYRSAWSFYRDGTRELDIDTVFIPHAAGGVGMALIQVGKYLGYKVVATAGSTQGCDLVSQWGADKVINYTSQDVAKEVLDFTGARGADLIYDHIGGEAFAANFDMLAPRGMMFILNERGGPAKANIFEILRDNPDKAWKIRSWSMHTYDRHHARREELVAEVVEMLKSGALTPGPLNRIPLSEAAQAHALREQHRLPGKTILIP